jgi:hypothetical protein
MIIPASRLLATRPTSGNRPHLPRGWMPLLVLPAVAFLLVPAEWPRWKLMWLLSLSIYAGCKWLTWRRATIDDVPLWRHAAYLLAWPGLDATTFLQPTTTSPADQPQPREWLFATTKFVIGLTLLSAAILWIPHQDPYVAGWVGMVGLIFTLHFGLFDLLSCVWRRFGIKARPLMNWPLLSASVSEFWGMRWNRAFRDLTHRFLFRPLTSRFGPRIALGLGFVVSGLLHELVITLPAGGGYGGPTLYFLIQGSALFVERSAFGRRLGLGAGFRGWLFTACTTVSPVCLLFPPAFVERIIVPFLEFVGSVL